jgi:hypothetical protein
LREVASVNFDDDVNVLDFMLIATHASIAGQPLYVTGLDVTRDGAINVIDLLVSSKGSGIC